MRINIKDVENIQIGGACPNDYPKFCDAFIEYATWSENGDELTDEQLEWLTEDYPELVNELAFESFL